MAREGLDERAGLAVKHVHILVSSAHSQEGTVSADRHLCDRELDEVCQQCVGAADKQTEHK